MALYDVFVSGIDFNLSGNGGRECLDYSSGSRRILESLGGMGLSIFLFLWGYRTLPHKITHSSSGKRDFSGVRTFLLGSSSFVFGMEMCYKFASRQAVFCFNPCHLLLLIQIYLLGANETSRSTQALYRFHLCLLHGPVMAILFPVTNTRFLPGEVATFWLEHIFLVINPVYLILSGSYGSPPQTFKQGAAWVFVSYGLWGAFHYVILQPLGLWTAANLNSILCPAISDPFYGPDYRTHAIWHQFLLTFTSGITCFALEKKAKSC